MLAINCSTMAEAEKSLPNLPQLITSDKNIADAWQRGRFIRNLRGLASVAVSVDEAAKRLDLADPDDLHRMIETDPEIRDTWYQTRQEAVIRIKLALVKTALDGNQAAIRAVENFLRTELELKKTPDMHKLKPADIALLTNRARTTIYDWIKKDGLPVDEDKNIELRRFIKWFELYITDSIMRKCASPKMSESARWHQLKAEKLERELKQKHHELLPREEVMAGLLARHQVLINWVRQKAPQIAHLCQGQKPDRTMKIIIDSFTEACRQLCHVPDKLHLSDKAAATYALVLETITSEIAE